MTRREPHGVDLPLLRWGEELRRTRIARRRLQRRTAACAGLIALLSLTIIAPPLPRLVWNASASAPLGLYAVTPHAVWVAGDMVIARVPQPIRKMAAARGYLPADVPLVKRIVAVPGDMVCATSNKIFVRGRWVATRRARDGLGRILPWWNGCTLLRDGRYFLLMADAPASFDGRYFGITRAADIVGKARLLWRY